MAQTMRETWVQSLGQEDPLEKEMAIHSSTIAWKSPWTEEPGRLQSTGSQRVDFTLVIFIAPSVSSLPLSFLFFFFLSAYAAFHHFPLFFYSENEYSKPYL